jgi:hypothetical protein
VCLLPGEELTLTPSSTDSTTPVTLFRITEP